MLSKIYFIIWQHLVKNPLLPKKLAILGAGLQARSHVKALREIFTLSQVSDYVGISPKASVNLSLILPVIILCEGSMHRHGSRRPRFEMFFFHCCVNGEFFPYNSKISRFTVSTEADEICGLD